MTTPRLSAGNTAELSCVCSLVAAIDPTTLFFAGFAIVLVALFVTWRPVPKSGL